MPTAFLTGGTGFVGGHAARALRSAGWTVRMLVRDPRRAEGGLLDGLEFDRVACGLEDGAALREALSGVDAIVHVAGLTKARSLADYRAVNVGGTECLLTAGRAAVPDARFLLVSSQAAAGPARDGHPLRDGDPARPVSWYGVSKREGEQAVERGWPGSWIVLRPGVVYGPGDRGLYVYFKLADAGWVPVPAGHTRIQIIAAERLGVAITRALSRPDLSGRTGFVCDPSAISVGSLARAIAAGAGRRTRVFPVPDLVVRALGAAETAVEALTGRSRPFNADKARELLAGDWLCDGAALEQALDLPPAIPLEQGLRDAWSWYREASWLRRPRDGAL